MKPDHLSLFSFLLVFIISVFKWCIFLVILMLVFPVKAQANPSILSNPLHFLSQNGTDLLHLSSKEEAVKFFFQSDGTPGSDSNKRPLSPKSPSKGEVPVNIQEAISHLMAGLVVIAAIQESEADDGNPSDTLAGTDPVNINVSETQRLWLAETPLREKLAIIGSLHSLLVSLQSLPQVALEADDQGYLHFAEYYDKSYPAAGETLSLWLEIGRKEGIQGLEGKLKEFWQTNQRGVEATIPDSTKTLYGRYYLGSRLVPQLRGGFQRQLLALKTQALELVLAHIQIVSQWQKEKRDTATLSRICGSWLWTVHNHQNHRDHKMTVYFFPSDQLPPNQPTPTTIAVHGDTVYLEWNFPQGRQEDSLLLSNRDTILEGTFKNSLGPYGSISGKRLTTCRN